LARDLGLKRIDLVEGSTAELERWLEDDRVDLVVGEDVLREHQLPVAPLVNLGFGGCRMAVAVKASSGYRRALDLPAHCRVASKFTRCAEAFFEQIDLPVELIHLTGSVELGPLTGMSEAIVDLVASGRTLKDNGLVAIEVLFESTARLIGHPLALRLDQGQLQTIVGRLAALAKSTPSAPSPMEPSGPGITLKHSAPASTGQGRAPHTAAGPFEEGQAPDRSRRIGRPSASRRPPRRSPSGRRRRHGSATECGSQRLGQQPRRWH
jgi:ATP phosphoribosyltransferase